MRTTLTTITLVAGLCAACLSKPSRPTGDEPDADTDADAAMFPDGPPVPPGTVARRNVEVTDLDGDGYDDMIRWGNLERTGGTPAVFVWYGNRGAFGTPSEIHSNLRVTVGQPHYEVLDVETDELTGAPPREMLILTGEDAPSAVERTLYGWIHDGTTFERTQAALGPQMMGGNVRTEEPAWIIARTHQDTSVQMFFGGVNEEWVVDGVPDSLGEPASVTFQIGSNAVQEVFDANGGGTTETIIVVGNEDAWRSTSADGLTGIPSSFGSNTLRGARGPRVVPGTLSLAVAATDYLSTIYHFVEIPSGTAPVGNPVGTTGEVRDIALGEIGGDADLLDVVTIEDGALRIYRDHDGSGTPAQFIFRDLALANDDLLAIGNFYNGTAIEILVLDGYALGVKGCYILTGPQSDMIVEC